MFRDNFQNTFLHRKELITVTRVTALWAFSEAAFGGVLHALKVPFTGLFMGGAAVIFLTLIAHFANKNSVIIHSTIIVVLVKGIVSPHSPLTAYFAVMLQGFLASLLFSLIKQKKVASLLLGILALGFASFQKLIVLTILFGMTFWESIDVFGNYVMSELMMSDLQLSHILIGGYAAIHIIGGVVFGFLAGNVINWISKNKFRVKEYNELVVRRDDQLKAYQKRKRKKRVWWKKKSGIAFLLFSTLMILIVYFNPQFDNNLILGIILMIARSLIVTLIWFGLLSPIVIKFIRKYLAKKKSQHTKEIDEILSMFPFFKGILNYSWDKTSDLKNRRRLIPFFKNTFVLLLLAEINLDE